MFWKQQVNELYIIFKSYVNKEINIKHINIDDYLFLLYRRYLQLLLTISKSIKLKNKICNTRKGKKTVCTVYNVYSTFIFLYCVISWSISLNFPALLLSRLFIWHFIKSWKWDKQNFKAIEYLFRTVFIKIVAAGNFKS